MSLVDEDSQLKSDNECGQREDGARSKREENRNHGSVKETVIPNGSVMLNRTRLKQVNGFKYPGTSIIQMGNAQPKYPGGPVRQNQHSRKCQKC